MSDPTAWLSVAFRVTVTPALLQPTPLAFGVVSAVVDGAIVSSDAKVARLLATDRPAGLSDETFTIERACIAGSCMTLVSRFGDRVLLGPRTGDLWTGDHDR